jgi:hypothetical protein
MFLTSLLSSLASILFLASSATAQTTQRPLIEPGTNIRLGDEDYFVPDYRLVETKSTDSLSLDDQSMATSSIGLKQWGLVQVSLSMKSHPAKGDGFTLNSPFCRMTEETAGYQLSAELDIGKASYIYDYELAQDTVYVMVSDATLLAVSLDNGFRQPNSASGSSNQGSFSGQAGEEQVTPASLNVKWKITNLEDFSKQNNGYGFNEAGLAFHKKTKILYIPTNAGMLAVNTETKEIKKAAHGVYTPRSYILYCDIEDDFIFMVHAFSGIEIYNVANPDNIIKIGQLSGAFFDSSRPAGETYAAAISIHNHMVEVYTDNPKLLEAKASKGGLFGTSSTLKSKTDYIQRERFAKKLMVVATARAIYFVPLDSIFDKGQLPTSPLPHSIPLTEVVALARFHDTLYALTMHSSDPLDQFSVKSTAVEIFLYDPSLKLWEDPQTNVSTLYKINKKVSFTRYMENIYADENHFYVVGNHTTYLYERAIPADYSFATEKMTKQLYDKMIYAVVKFVVNGIETLVAVTPSKLSSFSISVSDPTLRCPYEINLADNYGHYTFEINATTRTCPTKETALASTSTFDKYKLIHSSLCVWTKTLEVDYAKSSLLDSKKNTKIILGVLLVLMLIALCLLAFCWRRNMLVQREYELLRKEISTVKPVEENQFYGEGKGLRDMAGANKGGD